MEINQMFYFKQIVEANFNLTEAAKKIHISQSALSQFINQLEENYEAKMFERKHNRLVGLTAVGQIIYQAACEIVAIHDDMESTIYRIVANQQERLTFGSTSSYPQILLPDFFTQFTIDNPTIFIDLVEHGAKKIREQFIKGEYDFALLMEPIELPDNFAKTRLVYEDELAAYMSVDHPLANRENVSWEDLAAYPIVTLNQEYGTYEKVHTAFSVRELNPYYAFYSSAWQYLIDSVKKNSKSITIMPQSTPTFSNSDHLVMKKIRNAEKFRIVLAQKITKKHTKALRIVEKELEIQLPTIE